MLQISRIVAAVALLALVPASPAAAATPPSQWAQAGYGPGNTYYNPTESVVNTKTIAKLKLRWSRTAADGEPGCSAGPGTPRVVNGRVFMIDGTGVSAFDAKTGKLLWSNEGFSYISADLVVVGDLLIVNDTNCYSNSNYDGHVTALDVRTGKERWHNTGSWMVDTVVADAGMVVTSGYCHTCADFENGVIGIRTSDGKQVWARENTVLTGPVTAGGRIMLASTESSARFVAAVKTGTKLYAVPAGYRAVAATADRFYVAGGSGLSAIDAKKGKLIWTTKTEFDALAADGNRVFVTSAGKVKAYTAKTGKVAWTRPVAGATGLARAGGLLYVTTETGALSILAPPTGKPVTSGAAYSPAHGVIVTGGTLFTIAHSAVRAFTP